MPEKSAKPAHLSQVTLTQLTVPEHANVLGNVHGGVLMKMVDEAGAICAMRHAQRPCVTIAIDSMTFRQPVHVGLLVNCSASVTYVGKSSIEVEVKVQAENLITGETTHTNSAFVVYVALDENGRPTTVPQLELVTDEQRRRFQEGEQRQLHRIRRTRKAEQTE